MTEHLVLMLGCIFALVAHIDRDVLAMHSLLMQQEHTRLVRRVVALLTAVVPADRGRRQLAVGHGTGCVFGRAAFHVSLKEDAVTGGEAAVTARVQGTMAPTLRKLHQQGHRVCVHYANATHKLTASEADRTDMCCKYKYR